MEDSEKAFVENVDTKSIFNPKNDKLPYGYFDPEREGKLFWICNYDAEQKITSVFVYDYGTHQDRNVQYINTLEEAKNVRNTLVESGWKKLVSPKITFTYPGVKEGKPLNRKQKRYLKRKIKQLDRQTNPYRN